MPDDLDSKNETTIEVTMTLEQIGWLALQAHNIGVTLNAYIVQVATEYADDILGDCPTENESVTDRVSRGEAVCRTCGETAKEPVVGWFFTKRHSYCPQHTPR